MIPYINSSLTVHSGFSGFLTRPSAAAPSQNQTEESQDADITDVIDPQIPDINDQIASMVREKDRRNHDLYGIAFRYGHQLREIMDCLDQKVAEAKKRPQVVEEKEDAASDKDLPMSDLLSPIIQCVLEDAGFKMSFGVNRLQTIPNEVGRTTPLRWLMENEMNDCAIDLLKHIEQIGFNDFAFLKNKKESAGLISEMMRQRKILPDMFLLKIRQMYIADYSYSGLDQFYEDFHERVKEHLPDMPEKTLLHLSPDAYFKIVHQIASAADDEIKKIEQETPFDADSDFFGRIVFFTPCDRLVHFEKGFYFNYNSETLAAWCIRKRELAILKELHSLGFNFQNDCTPLGISPLVYSVVEGSQMIMEFFLENDLHRGRDDLFNAIAAATGMAAELRNRWFVFEKESRVRYYERVADFLRKYL